MLFASAYVGLSDVWCVIVSVLFSGYGFRFVFHFHSLFQVQVQSKCANERRASRRLCEWTAEIRKRRKQNQFMINLKNKVFLSFFLDKCGNFALNRSLLINIICVYLLQMLNNYNLFRTC